MFIGASFLNFFEFCKFNTKVHTYLTDFPKLPRKCLFRTTIFIEKQIGTELEFYFILSVLEGKGMQRQE